MAQKQEFSIKGFEQISQVMRKLPARVVDKEVQTILKRNGKPTLQAMKDIVGEHKGTLKKQIKHKAGKPKHDVIDLWAGVQNTRFSRAPHWHLVAFGTKLRKVDSYKTKHPTKRKLKPSRFGRGIVVNFTQGKATFVHNTGIMPANPYATKALARTNAVTAAENQKDLNKYLNRKAKALMKKYAIARGRQ